MKTIDKIKKYYKNDLLEVLDGGKPYEFLNHYVAVSCTYIYETLLKKKVTKKFVAKTIYKLCEEGFLLPIPCGHADDLVFCTTSFAKGKLFVKFTVKNGKIYNKYYFDKEAKYVKDFNDLLE